MLMRRVLGLILIALIPIWLASPAAAQIQALMNAPATFLPGELKQRFAGDGSGTLQVLSEDGKNLVCPLKHTDVHASISGYVARVTVKQTFANPFKNKIEAVYTFPLSDTGAVDDMVMRIGTRTIHGTIKKREEARAIYEQARNAGNVAALLDQERSNIFTQSVANIEPGKQIEVTLSYVDLLPYQSGSYKFAFPTVVGPRFNPGQAVGRSGLGFSPDTAQVPDASKITPHVAPHGVRAGHDISISVAIDAGLPIGSIDSQLHQVKVERSGKSRATVSLVDKNTIPNKDFVLSWGVSTNELRSGSLTNGKNGSGYFTLMILPPKKAAVAQVQPKEMIFLIDCSGSQSGAPLQKAKEAMRYCFDHMNDNDTFQVISFNNLVTRLFEQPRPANAQMRTRAKEFVESLDANGGTWMAPAVEAACKEPTDSHRLRIVSFMTDGFVGNDLEILGLIRKLRGTSRWFPFGTGNSVNRMLIDSIAREGGGEPDYVYLNSDAPTVGRQFYEKIASPVLTDIKVSFGDLSVKEVFPREISDVWEQRPLYLTGRYEKAGTGTVTISGYSGGKPYSQKLTLALPENSSQNAVLGSIWARAKVDRLMAEDYSGAQSGDFNQELKDEIVKVALDHHIMTQFTSFVAVQEKTVTKGGAPVTIEVPVELPDGVSRSGVFADREKQETAFGGRATSSHLAALRRRSLQFSPGFAMAKSQFAGYGAPAPSLPPPPYPTGVAQPIPHAASSAMPMVARGGPAAGYMAAGGYGGGGAGGSGGAVNNLGSFVAGKVLAANAPQQQERTLRSDAPGKDLKEASRPAFDRAGALKKLSQQLRSLVNAKIKGNDTQVGAVKIVNGRVFVRLSLKKANEKVRDSLAGRGLDVTEVIFGDAVIYGWVSIDTLLTLAADANVVHVEASVPR